MLKSARVGNAEVLLRSHDGRNWFARPADVLDYRRRRERIGLALRTSLQSKLYVEGDTLGDASVNSLTKVSLEKELWLAVLVRAATDLYGMNYANVRANKRAGIQRAAIAWFESHSYSPGSFRWVCDMLDLPPETVRRRVLPS